MNNKELGNSFEKEFCDYLSQQGHWVHFIEPNKSGGQPFDVISAKNGIVYAYDCKTNKGKRFRLDRIEENQQFAFGKFNGCGNYNSYFAIKNEKGIYIYPSLMLIALKKQDIKSVELEDEYLCSKQDFN